MKQCSNVTMNKGFTIIELLVVISVIIILTAIVLISYRSGQQQFALQRSANKLAQDIRRTQEMAMSARECTHPTACPAGGVPLGGYGIYMEKEASQIRNYKIYADGDNNEKYDSGEEIETIYLEDGVEFQSVQPANKMSVNFKPPDPTIELRDQTGADKTNVTIIIALTADSSKTKTILVNRAGRIEID